MTFDWREAADRPLEKTTKINIVTMSDFFPIKRFDHLEFYVGNARQAAIFYSKAFGFTNTAYRGLETGERKTASYVMEQGEIRLVLSTALSPDHPISQSVLQHGNNSYVISVLEYALRNRTIWTEGST